MTRVVLLAVSVAGCAGVRDARPTTKTPPVDHPTSPGPDSADREAVLRWLPAQLDDGRPAVVRLPVVVALSTSFMLGGGAIAGSLVPLHLDDAALGIGLADHVRSRCPGSTECPLWLEGRWTPGTLAVLRVVGPVRGPPPWHVAVVTPAH